LNDPDKPNWKSALNKETVDASDNKKGTISELIVPWILCNIN